MRPRAEAPASTPRAPALATLVRRHLTALHPPDPELSRAALEARAPELAGLPEVGSVCPEVAIDLPAPGSAALDFAADQGLSLEALARIGAEEAGGTEGGNTGFFEAGGWVGVDPFTGRRLVSVRSLAIDDDHVAYAFAGAETFHVVVGAGGMRFVSIPRLNCVVTFGGDAAQAAASRAAHRGLMQALVRHGALAARPAGGQRHWTGVAVGFAAGLGEAPWRELAGLEAVIAGHGGGAVRHVLAGPHLPASVGDVFPELAECPVTQVAAGGARLAESLDLPYQHIRPDAAIGPGLRRRVGKLADAAGPGLQQRMGPLTEGRFVAWIGLGAGPGAWRGQAEGYAAVLPLLAAEFGAMTVVLDGPEAARGDAAVLRARLAPQGIGVVETLGCGVAEAVAWARRARVLAAPVGPGLLAAACFAGRACVAHGNRAQLDLARGWAELGSGAAFIDPATVGGGLGDGYELDPGLLHAALRRAAGAADPAPAAGAARWRLAATFHGMRLDPSLPVSGLSHAEPDGTWTLGGAFQIGLPGLAPPGVGLALTLAVYPNILPGICDAQRVTILVNSGQVWDGAVLRQSEIRALVPAALVAGAATITVSLALPDAIAPAADGVSGDIRPLGLMLQSLVLEARPG